MHHFNTPKTLKEALVWLQANNENFDRLKGYVETDLDFLVGDPATVLNLLNGIDYDGRKIRTGSKRAQGMLQFADTQIDYYAIEYADYGDFINVKHNFFSTTGLAKYEDGFKATSDSYEMIEI
jgi:hypothetical protein